MHPERARYTAMQGNSTAAIKGWVTSGDVLSTPNESVLASGDVHRTPSEPGIHVCIWNTNIITHTESARRSPARRPKNKSSNVQ